MNLSLHKMSPGIFLILACLIIVARSSSPHQGSFSGEESCSDDSEYSCSEDHLDFPEAAQPLNDEEVDRQMDPQEELKSLYRKVAACSDSPGSLPPRISKRINVLLTTQHNGQPAPPENPQEKAEKHHARETKLESPEEDSYSTEEYETDPEEDHHPSESSSHEGTHPVTCSFHPMIYDDRAWRTRPMITADEPEAREITRKLLDFFYWQDNVNESRR